MEDDGPGQYVGLAMASAVGTDAQWADIFLGAALEPHRWEEALSAMARATGSHHGQMVGFGPAGAAFNWISDVDPAIIPASPSIDHGSPGLNYRVGADLLRDRPDIVHEAHYDIARQSLHAADYLDLCADFDIFDGCQTRLHSDRGGMIGLALGKHGAGELNYSSDIDLILLYDPETLPRRQRDEPGEAAQRYARETVRLLSEVTSEGYVFRVDLRLRPASEITPLAVSINAAASHYESAALPWERAAFIRARSAAGDIARGERFLASIRPFVWRRSVDFGAIDDIAQRNQLDRERLQQEVEALPEEAWNAHPTGYAGNSSVRLISAGGGENDDMVGDMQPTRWLQQMPVPPRHTWVTHGEPDAADQFRANSGLKASELLPVRVQPKIAQHL